MLRQRLQRNIQETSDIETKIEQKYSGDLSQPQLRKNQYWVWHRPQVWLSKKSHKYKLQFRLQIQITNYNCKYKYKYKLRLRLHVQGPDLSLVSDPDSGFGGPGALWICHLKEIGFQLKYHFVIWRNRILSFISLCRGPSPPSHILLFLLSRVRQWFWLLPHKITTQVINSLSHHLTISLSHLFPHKNSTKETISTHWVSYNHHNPNHNHKAMPERILRQNLFPLFAFLRSLGADKSSEFA